MSAGHGHALQECLYICLCSSRLSLQALLLLQALRLRAVGALLLSTQDDVRIVAARGRVRDSLVPALQHAPGAPRAKVWQRNAVLQRHLLTASFLCPNACCVHRVCLERTRERYHRQVDRTARRHVQVRRVCPRHELCHGPER